MGKISAWAAAIVGQIMLAASALCALAGVWTAAAGAMLSAALLLIGPFRVLRAMKGALALHCGARA